MTTKKKTKAAPNVIPLLVLIESPDGITQWFWLPWRASSDEELEQMKKRVEQIIAAAHESDEGIENALERAFGRLPDDKCGMWILVED